MEAFFCTDLQATPVQILQWVVMRWSVEVTCDEGRAHLGLETQRQWSDLAIARTTPVLLALFSIVTLLALGLSQGGPIPVEATAWYHKTEPTFRLAFHRGVELVDASKRGEVGLDGLDRHAACGELLRRVIDCTLIGGDQQIETLFGAAFGQLVANASRRASEDGEWTCV